MPDKSSKLAIFDFDGTITKSDSLMPFLWHEAGAGRFLLYFGATAIWVAAFLVRIVSRHTAKERVLSLFLKGMSEERLNELGVHFARTHLPQMVRENALARLREHLTAGDRVLLISASAEFYLRPWAASVGKIEVLATRLEFDNADNFTGRILGHNCHGPEKVRRLAEAVPDFSHYYVIMYGDSKGDANLYEIADEANHRYF